MSPEEFIQQEGLNTPLPILMERYANSKTRELEAKVFDYRNYLSLARPEMVEGFDRHFDIKRSRVGQVSARERYEAEVDYDKKVLAAWWERTFGVPNMNEYFRNVVKALDTIDERANNSK